MKQISLIEVIRVLMSFMEGVADDLRSGQGGVLCLLIEQEGSTPRKEGASMWIRSDGSVLGTVGGGPMEFACVKEALSLLGSGEQIMVKDFDLASGYRGDCPEGAVCGGNCRVYFETILPDEEVFIFGAGHVGRALAKTARAAGFRVTVWDEREEYANTENIPEANSLVCPIDELMSEENRARLFRRGVYAVIVTRGHALDSEAMRLLEGCNVSYIGVIGSRGKIAFVDRKLREQGVSPEHLERIRRPIGLPIGAETPEEIAVSIMAEIIAVRRGANIEALRNAGKC